MGGVFSYHAIQKLSVSSLLVALRLKLLFRGHLWSLLVGLLSTETFCHWGEG